MYSLAQAGYTESEVLTALKNNRTILFGYELLDSSDNTIGEIEASDARIYHNSEASIQRSIQVTTSNDKEIDYSTDKIRPYMKLKMGNEYLIYPLGVFLMSSPTRRESSGSIVRTIDGYDKTQILSDDKFVSRYSIAAGTAYTTAVQNIVQSTGITKINIEHSDLETKTILEFPLGTSKLDACNELLSAINYVPIYADSHGYIRSSAYQLPEGRAIDAFYATDKESIICEGAEEELDIFGAPNKIVRYLENVEREYMISSVTNDNPNSKLSTVSRGRVITDIEAVRDMADKTSLDAYVQRVMAEKKVYQKLVFETLNMPNHESNDCLYVDVNSLGAYGKFIETAWEMDLRVGGKMRHVCRKAVSI